MKKIYFLTLALICAIAANAADLYIFGSFNGWDPQNSTKMTYANDVYTATGITFGTGGNFAVATVKSSIWDTVNANRYGFATDNAIATEGVAMKIVKGSGAMQVPSAGTYDIVVSLSAMTVTVTKSEEQVKMPVYITGSCTASQWSPENAEEFTYVEDQDHYYYYVNSTSAVEFKLSTAKGSWDTFNGSCLYANLANKDTEYTMSSNSGSNMKVPAGKWYIIVNLTTNKVKYTADDKLTGVEEIATENVAVEYYNLQGVKVANPENGIFIRKQGAKTTKVIL